MPLSEYEQRQLAELERALTTVDPGYVRRFAALPASRTPRRWSGVRGVLCRLRWWR